VDCIKRAGDPRDILGDTFKESSLLIAKGVRRYHLQDFVAAIPLSDKG
jgi:hypothetical protein